MANIRKIALFAAGGLFALLLLAAVALVLFVDVNAHKPRLEAAASDALGMEVRIGGNLGIGLFPGFHITVEDVRIRNRGADVACKEFRKGSLAVSNLKLRIEGKDGVIDLNPVTMRLFGGQGSGILRGDLSWSVPQYNVRYSLSRFRIEEFLKVLSPKKSAEGSMDFTSSLSMRGMTASEQTVAGPVLKLFRQAKNLFGGRCVEFYAGSVAPPEWRKDDRRPTHEVFADGWLRGGLGP